MRKASASCDIVRKQLVLNSNCKPSTGPGPKEAHLTETKLPEEQIRQLMKSRNNSVISIFDDQKSNSNEVNSENKTRPTLPHIRINGVKASSLKVNGPGQTNLISESVSEHLNK